MRREAAGGSGDSAAEALAGPAFGEMLGAATRQPETTKVARTVEREMKVFIIVEVHCRMPGGVDTQFSACAALPLLALPYLPFPLRVRPIFSGLLRF